MDYCKTIIKNLHLQTHMALSISNINAIFKILTVFVFLWEQILKKVLQNFSKQTGIIIQATEKTYDKVKPPSQ